MNKYGMMMVCGNSIEELEQDLAMLKMAVASGAMMGCGGATLADVEKGVAMLGGNLPSEHTAHCCGCGCGCCHDEDEDTAPPTIAEILEWVETGEITADEADDLIHEYYVVED
jgi:hypothetical protein